MPISVTAKSGAGKDYVSPFVGPINHTVGLAVALSGLTNKEIDSKGYVKAGVPFAKNGTLVTAGEFVFGVTVEATKVAADNEAATIAALGTVELAIAVIAVVNRDIAEDILERAYTADEVTGFDLAGSKVVLLLT